MNNTHLQLGNSAVMSHITRLINSDNDILILNLMSVHQCIIDDIDELHDEFLMIDDECQDKIVKFAAIAKKQ